jgi:hypothetical protein
MAAIKFLTTVARSVHHALFNDANVLKQICESIIIPNLQVSPSKRRGSWRGSWRALPGSKQPPLLGVTLALERLCLPPAAWSLAQRHSRRQSGGCPALAPPPPPLLQVREEDEEVFEMNPLEYIRRDAEGSDSDTRRRAAADLVRSLTEKYPEQVTQLCTGYVQVGAPPRAAP